MGTPIKNNVSKKKKRSSASRQMNAKAIKCFSRGYDKTLKETYERKQSAIAKLCKQNY